MHGLFLELKHEEFSGGLNGVLGANMVDIIKRNTELSDTNKCFAIVGD